MATGAKLSIMGLYNYNPEIFDDLTVPAGIDKETVIDNILMECYDFELLFPSYNLMKIGIRTWSKTELPIWEKLYNTENLEYNPIWNVDGDITETREVTREKSGQDNRVLNIVGDDNDVTTGVNNTDTVVESSGENTHSEAGYNETNLVITEKDENSSESTTNVDGSFTENRSGNHRETQNNDGSNSENETVGESLHTRRTGNIGVTTTQQMIREERDVVTFSTIKYITDSFKKRFCLLVY